MSRLSVGVLAMMSAGLLGGCNSSGGLCYGTIDSSTTNAAEPSVPCNGSNTGAMVCPAGRVGWGYMCRPSGCWEFFFDGPCTPTFPVCASPCSGSEGALRCRGDRSEACIAGCWQSPGELSCDAAPDGGQCELKSDAGACTVVRESELVCSGDAGLRCESNCWQSFPDAGC